MTDSRCACRLGLRGVGSCCQRCVTGRVDLCREREAFSDPDASWGHRSAVSTRKGGGILRLQAASGDLYPDGFAVGVGGSHRMRGGYAGGGAGA